MQVNFQFIKFMRSQGCVAFLPFARVSLKSLISKPYDFEPISVGDHIRKKRLQLGLFQREVAQQLGVTPWTIMNWEKGYTEPPIVSIPAIIQFLGYDPFPKPKTVSEHLRAKRRSLGWSIKQAAETHNVDPGTWGKWERGHTILYRHHRALVAKFLGVSSNEIEKKMALRWGCLHESKSEPRVS